MRNQDIKILSGYSALGSTVYAGGGGGALLWPCPFDQNLGKNVIEGGHDHVHFELLLIVSSARGGQCSDFQRWGGRTVGVV